MGMFCGMRFVCDNWNALPTSVYGGPQLMFGFNSCNGMRAQGCEIVERTTRLVVILVAVQIIRSSRECRCVLRGWTVTSESHMINFASFPFQSEEVKRWIVDF